MKNLFLRNLLILGFTALLGREALAETMEACKRVSDDRSRLRCYDAIGTEATPKSGTELSWQDVQLDYKKLLGTEITTKGMFMLMGEQGLLFDKPGGMTAFFVDVEGLDRERRSIIYNSCTGGCQLKVTGVLQDVMMQRGIAASNIELD